MVIVITIKPVQAAGGVGRICGVMTSTPQCGGVQPTDKKRASEMKYNANGGEQGGENTTTSKDSLH